MWELGHKESWAPKNWWFWTLVLEKTLESPLDCKEIQPVHPKGDQSWVFIGRTNVEAETPILWPPDAKSWLICKDPDAGKDWRQEENGTTEDEMVGCHHRLNRHRFGWTPGVGDGQGGPACWDSWGRKELDTTERLNWTELRTAWLCWGKLESVYRTLYLFFLGKIRACNGGFVCIDCCCYFLPFLLFFYLLKKIFFKFLAISFGHLAIPGGMWDLSSLTRDTTHTTCTGSPES